MRFSMFRSSFVAIAATVALAACSGNGAVPSQGVAPNSGFAPNTPVADSAAPALAAPDSSPVLDAAPDAVSKCDITGIYYFHGSCVAFNLNMTTNTTVELGKYGAYKGIKITTTFGTIENPPKGVKSIAALMGDATGNGDITGQVKGKNFPIYGAGKDCVNSQGKAEACPGKPFVYAELINTSKYTLKPKLTPKFVISDTNGFPGTRLCFPAILTPSGPHTVGGWAPNTTLGGQPHGDTLTINSQSNPGQLVYPPGPFIVAGVCE
jgi:hypothetical protein